MNRGLLLRMILPLNSHPTSLVSLLLGSFLGLGDAALSRHAPTNGDWLAREATGLVCKVKIVDSKSLSNASNAANKLQLIHKSLSLNEAEE